MGSKDTSSTRQNILRQKAEKTLTSRAQVKKMGREEVQNLVHELQVHQIELEMQNEELLQTQIDLEVARDRYATLFDFTPVGYVTLDDHGRILEANLTICNLLGVPRSSLLKKKFEEFIDPGDQGAFRLHLDALRTIAGAQSSNILSLRHPKHHVLRVRLESSLDTIAPSDAGGLFRLTVVDVTERERIQTAQEEQKALMEIVLSGMMDAIITTDEDQRIMLFNEAAAKLFRCPVSSALGQPIDRFLPKKLPIGQHMPHQHLRQGIDDARTGIVSEIIGLRSDGEVFPAEMTISQIQLKEKKKEKVRKLFSVVLRDITERRRAQETIKKEQQFISTILDTAAALIIVVDSQGRIVRFNRACELLTGFSFEEVEGKFVWDMVLPPSDVESIKEYFQALLLGRSSSVHENYWMTKKKVLRWVAWNNSILKDTQGKVEYVIGSGIDLTEQRNVRDKIEKERQFVSTVMDTAGVLVIILTPQWKILRMNRVCEQTFKPSLESLHGQVFWDLLVMTGEDDQLTKDVLEANKAGRLSCTFESSILDKARHFRWIQWTMTATYSADPDGAMEYIIVTGTDITERKKTEQLLQQNEGQLQAILDHSPLAIWLKDLDGKYVKINRQFEKIIGKSENSIVGKRDLQIFSAQRAEQIRDIEHHVIQTGQPQEYEEETSCSGSDTAMFQHVVKFLIKSPHGKPSMVCGIATDISQRKQVEKSLQETHQRLETQQQELRSLAAQLLNAQEEERRRISRDLHDDVNQRLALLSLKLQTMQKNLPDIHPVRTQLQELYENVAELSDDIRHIAYQYHPSILDDLGLGSALRSLCQDFEKWEQILVTSEVPDTTRKFSQSLATCLYRVAQESLRNVARHAKGATVHLALQDTMEEITLSIRDNGQGFDVDSHLSHGLGFVSMRERVRLVDGSFHVDSHPQQGTTVTVSIPKGKDQGAMDD